MSEIFDNLPDRAPLQRIWQGRIANTVSDFATRLSVTIPDWDPTLRWEGCRWQARNNIDFPHRGDLCLAILDNNNELWVVSWWPFQ